MSAIFTLSEFSQDGKTRLARCDHRAGQRKDSDEDDCLCRLWISTADGSLVAVKKKHSHVIVSWKVDYHKLKKVQDDMQDAHPEKVGWIGLL
jgi:hypothetical protein